MSALEEVGVRPDYEHISKLVRPQESLTLGGVVLKWYDIAPAEAPVPLAIRALARRNLRDGSKSGKLALSGSKPTDRDSERSAGSSSARSPGSTSTDDCACATNAAPMSTKPSFRSPAA